MYKTNSYVVYESSLRYQYGLEDRRWLNLNLGLLDYPHKFGGKVGVPVVFEKFVRLADYCTEVVEQRVGRRRLSKQCTGFRLPLVDLMTAPQRAERKLCDLVVGV